MLADWQQRFVVSESSGCLELCEGVSKYSLSRTHFDMNKFGKTTEEDFETVCEVIRTMTQTSQHKSCSIPSKCLLISDIATLTCLTWLRYRSRKPKCPTHPWSV